MVTGVVGLPDEFNVTSRTDYVGLNVEQLCRPSYQCFTYKITYYNYIGICHYNVRVCLNNNCE